jgi:hypothetical protein
MNSRIKLIYRISHLPVKHYKPNVSEHTDQDNKCLHIHRQRYQISILHALKKGRKLEWVEVEIIATAELE